MLAETREIDVRVQKTIDVPMDCLKLKDIQISLVGNQIYVGTGHRCIIVDHNEFVKIMKGAFFVN